MTPARSQQDGHSRDVAAQTETKAERTRSAIMGAALALFRERGYDATTMRAIAAEAGVSVGNAYYYYASKEQLIQGFYDRAQVEQAEAARGILDIERDLTARISGMGEVWLGIMEPYRPFAAKFFKNAAEPTSPLSPFSPESASARAASIDLWREVIDGSDARIHRRFRAELPNLLWLYFMGIVLFWVHDPTPNTAATRSIIRRSAPLIVRTIGLTHLPLVRGMLDEIIGLIDDIRAVFELGVTNREIRFEGTVR